MNRRRRRSPEATKSFTHLLCAGLLGPALSVALAPMYQVSAAGLALVMIASVFASVAIAAFVTGRELRHVSSQARFCRLKCADAAAAGGSLAGVLLAQSLPDGALESLVGTAITAALPPSLLFAAATGFIGLATMHRASRAPSK